MASLFVIRRDDKRGRHRLFFTNALLHGQSAYLANALAPETARISVTA